MWHKSESTVRPAPVETIKGYTYLRKNIEEQVRHSEEGDVTMYVYDERVFTASEYAIYSDIEYIAIMSDIDMEG